MCRSGAIATLALHLPVVADIRDIRFVLAGGKLLVLLGFFIYFFSLRVSLQTAVAAPRPRIRMVLRESASAGLLLGWFVIPLTVVTLPDAEVSLGVP